MNINFPHIDASAIDAAPFVVIWDQSRGQVKLLSGLLSIAMPPEMAEQLEQDLRAARTTPARAAA